MAGKLIIISGPSGVGKTTLIDMLAQRIDAKVSVSATTRAASDQETEAIDYYFLTKDKFEQMIRDGELLEYAQYLGNYYGTPKAPVDKTLSTGKDVILGIEVQGAKSVAKIFPDAIIIFLRPPSDDELRRRIQSRARDDEAVIQRRIDNAHAELAQAEEAGIYQYWVVNDQLDRAVDELVTICNQESNKNARSS